MLISGKRLKHYRTVRGFTLKQLAALVGVDYSTIQHTEQSDDGKRRTLYMDRFCDALGVKPEDLSPPKTSGPAS